MLLSMFFILFGLFLIMFPEFLSYMIWWFFLFVWIMFLISNIWIQRFINKQKKVYTQNSSWEKEVFNIFGYKIYKK
jgi:hypothetical protein